MKLKKEHWFVVLFTFSYILTFSIYYMYIKNYEFLWYILVLVLFFALVLFTIDKTKFDSLILWGLSIWGLLHMAGGGLIVSGDVLYNLEIIYLFDIGDTFVFKFDQFVHFYGFFVAALVAFDLLKRVIKSNNINWKWIYISAALISMGLGVVNEIVEFIATVAIENVNVGGYYNTSIDLIANALGAFFAIFVMRKRKK